MKESLLAGVALAGIAVMMSPASAQALPVGSSYDVLIDGTLRFGVLVGDQPGAVGRLLGGGENRASGRGGWIGNVGHMFNDGASINDAPGQENRNDHGKLTYFTPRWAGFQFGAGWRPDESPDGGDAAQTYANTYQLGLNYRNTFSDLGLSVSTIYVGAGEEDRSGLDRKDTEIWGAGAAIDYMGFGLGVGYADLGDAQASSAEAAAGADGGDWLTIGLRYTTGPWQVGGGYFTAQEDNVAGRPESSVDAWFIGFDYAVVPGWTIEGDVTFIEADSINKGSSTTALANDDGTVFAITNMMRF